MREKNKNRFLDTILLYYNVHRNIILYTLIYFYENGQVGIIVMVFLNFDREFDFFFKSKNKKKLNTPFFDRIQCYIGRSCVDDYIDTIRIIQ